jgi:CheY-like chemotaxis protein
MRSASVEQGFRLLGDQPYRERQDPFNFSELAADLRSLILSSRNSTPFTIGIEAAWGRGKSSLMGQLHDELRARNTEDGVEIRPVSFNAWTAEGQDVLEGLVKSVLEAMDKNALRRALRNKRMVSALKIPLYLVAGWLRVGNLVDEAWNAMSADARTRNQVNEVVTKAMRDWFAHVGEAGPDRLIVVFIDDLDRCTPENVLKVFEGLKLYLDAPGFVFVIGYDEGVITEAIASEKQYTQRATGRDYVEKIVQIVFRIPQPTDDEIDGLLTHFMSDSRTTDLFDDAGRKLVIDRNGRNPRRMKRFINRFILDYQLDAVSQDLDPELLIKLLILETYFPEFARLFGTATGKNPIQEFLDFLAAREQLRMGEDTSEVVQDVFRSYGIAPRDSTQESLAQLEQEAPEIFARLARDDDFLSLARSLEGSSDQELLLAKVQRRQELEVTIPPSEEYGGGGDIGSSASAGSSSSAPDLAALKGRRILWIDDHPSNNAKIVDQLRSYGAIVELADSGRAAQAIIRSFSPDILISDVGRGGDSNAGFDDLRALRGEGLYSGPAVFYSSRISTAMRSAASELNAPIVSAQLDLLRAIGDAVTPHPAAVA